jgi:hypothetical protein
MPMVPLALAPRVMRTVRLPLPSAVGRARVDVRNELVGILKRLLAAGYVIEQNLESITYGFLFGICTGK